jgi:hypothetical protein
MTNKYPFHGRHLVFLLPIFYVVIAEGVNALMNGGRWRKVLGALVVVLLLAQPVAQAGRSLVPSGETDIRSAVRHLRFWQGLGDKIYLNSESQWGYIFYCYYVSLPFFPGVNDVLFENVRSKGNEHYVQMISSNSMDVSNVYAWDRVHRFRIGKKGVFSTRLPRSGRTWVLLSQIDQDTERFFLTCLDSYGRKLDEFRGNNTSLYLYDLQGHGDRTH